MNSPSNTILQVTKILFEYKKNSKPRAYAIELVKDGKKQIVRARKEIILTLGAIHTPKILLLSGIGPAEDLKQFKIPLVSQSSLLGAVWAPSAYVLIVL
jgi:choline dehydrogenase-like flavoprotein